jgi:hypothetical protein
MIEDAILWCLGQGWNSLVPGVSELKDAIKQLGPVDCERRVTNGRQYEFADGTVQILVLNNETKIAKIRVSADYPDKELVPGDIDQVQQNFGFLEQTDVDESGTLTFSAPGLRLACDAYSDPHALEWIEFNDVDKQT